MARKVVATWKSCELGSIHIAEERVRISVRREHYHSMEGICFFVWLRIVMQLLTSIECLQARDKCLEGTVNNCSNREGYMYI